MNDKRKKILKLITAIRDSHPDMVTLYTEGQCYNFALILRSQFDGEFWYSYSEGHMYFKIDYYWYDIRGEHKRESKDSCLYSFKDGDPAYRWGRRDRRRLA